MARKHSNKRRRLPRSKFDVLGAPLGGVAKSLYQVRDMRGDKIFHYGFADMGCMEYIGPPIKHMFDLKAKQPDGFLSRCVVCGFEIRMTYPLPKPCLACTSKFLKRMKG